jgi:hypothetical protein
VTLEALSSGLKQTLDIDLFCIDGLIETTSMSQILDPPYYDWIQPASSNCTDDRTLQSLQVNIKTAFDYLDKIMAEEGPFDGILGYSQGASVACSYLMHLNDRDGSCGLLRIAIFFSSGGLSDAYFNSDLPGLRKNLLTQKLLMPSIHVYGTADKMGKHAIEMTRFWASEKATVITHPASHVIPRDAPTIGNIILALRHLMRGLVM